VVEAGNRQELLAVGRGAAQDGLNAVSAAEVRRHDVSGPDTVYRQVAELIQWETGTTIGTRQLPLLGPRLIFSTRMTLVMAGEPFDRSPTPV
jgi:hypothetical protein